MPEQDEAGKVNPMRSHEHLGPRRGFLVRDVLIGSLIIGLCVVFVEMQWRGNRATWRGALCQSNARQVGLALFMYAADYDGKLPAAAGSFTGLVTAARPYLRDSSRFYCPETDAASGGRRLSFRTPALYAGRPVAAGWPDPYLGGQPADPARTILLYESNTDQGTAIEPSYRHNGGAVCLIFTGQAAWEQDLHPPVKSYFVP